MLVFLDEIEWDRPTSLSNFGYNLAGKHASSTSLLVRGVRYSVIGFKRIQENYITSQDIDAESLKILLISA